MEAKNLRVFRKSELYGTLKDGVVYPVKSLRMIGQRETRVKGEKSQENGLITRKQTKRKNQLKEKIKPFEFRFLCSVSVV